MREYLGLVQALDEHRNKIEIFLIVAVIMIVFILRLGYVFTLPNTLTFDEPIYNEIVTNMLTGHGYSFSGDAYYTSLPFTPTSFQEPIYPYFLASIYKLIGLESFKHARAIQAVLNTISIILIMLVASRIWNRRIGIIAGMFGAFYVPLVYFTGLLMTENLFIFWLLLFLLMWMVAMEKNNLGMQFLSGIAFGAACLTRGMLLYFLPILLIITLVFSAKKFSHSLLSAGLVLLGVAITIAPWTYRNYVVQKAFIPLTTKGGYNLYIYTYPAESLDFNNRFDQIPIPDISNLNEVQRASLYRNLAIANIKSFPLLQLKFAFYKLVDFWNPQAERGPWFARILYIIMFAILLIFSILGGFRIFKNNKHIAVGTLLITLIMFHMLAAAIFTGGGKARLIVEPLMIILAGGGITLLSEKYLTAKV